MVLSGSYLLNVLIQSWSKFVLCLGWGRDLKFFFRQMRIQTLALCCAYFVVCMDCQHSQVRILFPWRRWIILGLINPKLNNPKSNWKTFYVLVPVLWLWTGIEVWMGSRTGGKKLHFPRTWSRIRYSTLWSYWANHVECCQDLMLRPHFAFFSTFNSTWLSTFEFIFQQLHAFIEFAWCQPRLSTLLQLPSS